MRALRIAWAPVVALMLAACANSVPPDPLGPADPQPRTDPAVPAQATPARPPAPPTGGPHPPQRHAHACKVDADCRDMPHCQGTTCRCVRQMCIADKPPVDPVIDPAPVPPPET